MAEPSLRLAFLGTPEFALPTLRALLESHHQVVCVYTQPPRKAGRGHRTQPSPVHAEAQRRGIETRTPASLKDEAAQREFTDLKLDAAVVVAYGLILPKPILDAPRLGCVNVHASLLPRWRGAAPIQRAILAGDDETGVSIMLMDEGLDTGPVLLREKVAIDTDTDAEQLHDTLAELGGRLIVPALERFYAGELEPEPQSEAGAIYAEKLTPDDRRIDWNRPAIELERLIRAFAPKPGATATLPDGETLKILRAEVDAAAPSGSQPGTVVDAARFRIACVVGTLRLTRVQRGGKAPMNAEDFLRGYTLEAGSILT